MENLGLSPLPNGTVRLFSEYKNKDLAYVGGTETKYVPIGDRVEVNVGPDKDITIQRRVKDQKIGNVVARQYKRRLDDEFVLYYDLVDYDETFFYEEELVSGKPVPAKIEVERQFDANVVLWGEGEEPKGWTSNEPGAYVDLHTVAGRVETGRSAARQVFPGPEAGEEAEGGVQRDVQAAEGRAGTEHREEAGAAINNGWLAAKERKEHDRTLLWAMWSFVAKSRCSWYAALTAVAPASVAMLVMLNITTMRRSYGKDT